ncbi:MAG: DNA repair protein RadC, partial [Candidatus Omnitrophica bacterium]|nr:DNA repair protein RadC [Candidatus Omnitrophota bacterium]
GSLNASLVHPREVFKPAILQNATGLILVHNHPSGEEKPSSEDLEITARLVEAGKLIGIDVIDHIIVGNKFYSFADNDLIKHR